MRVLQCLAVVAACLSGAAARAAEGEAPTTWEGAIGPVINHSPAFSGARDHRTTLLPGFFVRYGRFTATNAGGFVTRKQEEVDRGVAADLLRGDQYRLNVAMRFDGGRNSSDSPLLSGLGNVRVTLRARLGLVVKLDRHWRTGTALSADLMGRGGGVTFDQNLQYVDHLSPRMLWHTTLGVSAADQRYMQSYFGVTDAQAAASRYTAHRAGAGLRDVHLGTGLNIDLGERWVAFGDIGTARLLGPALASPLTQRAWGWSTRVGVAWRF